jgi:gas vesicle protein
MKNKLILPVVAGAAAAAALTYIFTTEDGKELQGKIAKAIDEHLPGVGEHIKKIGETIKDQLAGLATKGKDVANDIQG